MNQNTRIELTDTALDAVMKLSEGNPGAVTVCARLLKEAGAIDPDDFMGGLGSLLGLDSHGIYGSNIWVLYKDLCGESLKLTCAVLRSIQLGFNSESTVKGWISKANSYQLTEADRIAIQDALKTVQARLPNFGRN